MVNFSTSVSNPLPLPLDFPRFPRVFPVDLSFKESDLLDDVVCVLFVLFVPLPRALEAPRVPRFGVPDIFY